MSENENNPVTSFYDRPNVQKDIIPVGSGIPFGMESVTNSELGIGGAYGAWGASYNNEQLPAFVSHRLGEPLPDSDVMNLSELGFVSRHHIEDLSDEEHLELEVEVGARILKEAAHANGWDPSEVEGVMIGMSGPVSLDFVEKIARRAGIPETSLTVSVHKACDGSMGALHLALNPELSQPGQVNVAKRLFGKKVLVGGIEGLSRFTIHAKDKNALQLFGNGAGVIGVIPGETMKLMVGKSFENYDQEGLLQVRMYYPHSKGITPGKSLLDIYQDAPNHVRVAGMMHEPADGLPIVMAGLMGMVKLFVRSGVQVAPGAAEEPTLIYQAGHLMRGHGGGAVDVGGGFRLGGNVDFDLGIAQASGAGQVTDQIFGAVSAASCMIAFLRQLPKIKPGDHILFDGFGAGTYYDVMAVSMG